MKNLSVHFTSKKQDWATPQDFFDKLDIEFNFEWDSCADSNNTKIPGCYYDEKDDALSQEWSRTAKVFWMNPPYNKCSEFIKKAYEESQQGCTVVCLIPARTDTQYFHNFIMKAKEIRFVKGRLKFEGGESSAPFPSMIVIFTPGNNHPTINTITKNTTKVRKCTCDARFSGIDEQEYLNRGCPKCSCINFD